MPNKPSPFRLLSVLAFLIAPWAYGQTASTTALSLSARSVPHGTAVTLSAFVEANGSPVAPGLVTFADGKTVLGSAQLLSGGTASLKVMAGLGTHVITARFAGTKSFSKSNSSPQSVTVTGTMPTATTINVTGNAGSYTLSGTVTSSGVLPPTGSVSFADQTNHLSPGSAALGGATTTQAFGAQTVYNANDPTTVAAGDLNGDGIPDLVSANQSHTLSVLLGAGDGTFKITTSDYSGGSPQAAVVSDFNSDGIPDLAIANQGPVSTAGNISILLGVGNGAFNEQTPYQLGMNPTSLATGDWNGDGVPDLVMTAYADSAAHGIVAVLFGNGKGGFVLSGTYPVEVDPRSVAVSDLNGDGISDLVVANAGNGTLSVLLGSSNGDGIFGKPSTYPVGAAPSAITINDFNGDGTLDLASTNQGDSTVSVLLGKGDGTFQIQAVYKTGTQPSAVAVGDFNNDGRPDLVITNQGDSTVSVLLGQGDGTFGGQAVYPLSSGAAPLSVAIDDFNGDGVPDLATASHAGLLSVLLGNLTQTATATLNPVALIGTGTHQVAASYGGDSFHEASTSSTTPLIAFSPAFTSLALTAAPPAITAGQPLTLQAILGAAAQSFNTNGESVTFYNGWKVLGTASLHNGQAALTTTVLTGGANLIFATFAGDGNLTGATSNTVAVTVNAGNAGSDFTLAPLQPTETVPPGGLAGLVLALQSVNGFGGQVTLSCFGGPAGSSCLEFPLTVPLSGTTYVAAGVLFPPGTNPGTYTITFQAVTFKSASGSVTHATTVRFTVL